MGITEMIFPFSRRWIRYGLIENLAARRARLQNEPDQITFLSHVNDSSSPVLGVSTEHTINKITELGCAIVCCCSWSPLPLLAVVAWCRNSCTHINLKISHFLISSQPIHKNSSIPNSRTVLIKLKLLLSKKMLIGKSLCILEDQLAC
jgi:hypothetical protein